MQLQRYSIAEMRAFRRSLRQHVYTACQGHCCYCGTWLAQEKATLDHLVPMSQGGRLVEQNLVLACKGCNQRKGRRSVEEFLTPDAAKHFVRFAFTAGQLVRRFAVLVATKAA